MTTATWIIALAGFGLASLTAISTHLASRRKASTSYVEQLEKRIDRQDAQIGRLESQLEAERVRSRALEEENLRLMRKLVGEH
ncbi:MAG: hypothetical protein WD739_07430 [Actinomycetota bacterium]